MRFSKHILTAISEARNCRLLLTAGFFVGLLVLNVLAWRGWSIEEASRLMPLRCPLFLLTGIQCPTCGLGRSVVAAAVGEWTFSFHYHPFGIPILLVFFALTLALWLCPARIGPFAAKLSSFFKTQRILLWILIFLYAAWGFLRHADATDDPAYLKPLLPGVEATPIMTVGETVPFTGDPSRSYRLVGIPDGMGAHKTPDGMIRLFVNHELKKETVSQPIVGAPFQTGAFVSELLLTPDLKIVSGRPAFTTILRGPDSQPAGGSLGRLCSGFLAGPHTGFDRFIYLAGEEAQGADTLDGRGGQAIAVANGIAYLLPEMGRYSKENVVVVPETGIKTVVFGLEDGPHGLENQLYLYVGEKKLSSLHPMERNGLVGGKLYFFKATTTEKTDESKFHKSDGTIVGRWILLPNISRMNDEELEKASRASGSFNFDQLEDGTYDRRRPGLFYFVSTGGSGVNRRGRLYKLSFDPKDPVNQPSTLEILLEGDAGDPVANPDNLDANEEGQLLIEEDTASLKSFLAGRANSLWLYDLKSGKLERVAEALNRWEPSGGIDASAFFGPGSWLVNVQAHSISSREASRLQGYDQDAYLAEGGQILLLKTR